MNPISVKPIADEDLGAGSRPCWTVPFERNTGFVGRGSLLNKLETVIFDENQPSKVSLFGLGGVGKTQVVLELAYRTRVKHPDCTIIWIPVYNAERLQQAYLDAAEKLGIAVANGADVKRAVQAHLSQESAGRWLLIYDNADEFDVWTGGTGPSDSCGLLEYVPQSSQGCTVFTTRNRKIAVFLSSQGLREEVPQMDDETAQQLLFRRLNLEVPETLNDAQELVAQLCYLPLAIVQAAAYIEMNGVSLTEYLALLAEQEEDVIELLSFEFGDEGSYKKAKDPVATTWLVSFKQLQRSDPIAVEYLSLLCCFAPKDIPRSLLPPKDTRKQELDAIGTLTAYAFVTRHQSMAISKMELLDMHRLVHLAMRNWLREGERSLSQWTRKAASRLAVLLPIVDHFTSSLSKPYLSHGYFLLKSIPTESLQEPEILFLWRFGKCTYFCGLHKETVKCFTLVLKNVNKDLLRNHPDIVFCSAFLVSSYSQQGLFQDAEDLHRQFVQECTRVMGVKHPFTLFHLRELGDLLREQGRWDESTVILKQLMDAQEAGTRYPVSLFYAMDLAKIAQGKGRWNEAEQLMKMVIMIHSLKSGCGHPDTLHSMEALTLAYLEQGSLKEAEELCAKALGMCMSTLGAEHPRTLALRGHLVSIYCGQNRWDKARALQGQTLGRRAEIFGADHPETIGSMCSLAMMYCDQGQFKEAETVGLQAMEACRTLPATHSSKMLSVTILALAYRCQCRFEEAGDLLMKEIVAQGEASGLESQSTLELMQSIIFTWAAAGGTEKAKSLMDECIRRLTSRLTPDHERVLALKRMRQAIFFV